MTRLTVRLPESLHRQLDTLARREGVSLNQFIVYTLTRQSVPVYTVRAQSDAEIEAQRAQLAALRERMVKATPESIQRALDSRQEVDPEPDLDPGAAKRLRGLIAAGSELEDV